MTKEMNILITGFTRKQSMQTLDWQCQFGMTLFSLSILSEADTEVVTTLNAYFSLD